MNIYFVVLVVVLVLIILIQRHQLLNSYNLLVDYVNSIDKDLEKVEKYLSGLSFTGQDGEIIKYGKD